MHGFLNRSGDVARCLCVLTPGVLGPDYFRELAEVVRAARPDPEVVRKIITRYKLFPE